MQSMLRLAARTTSTIIYLWLVWRIVVWWVFERLARLVERVSQWRQTSWYRGF